MLASYFACPASADTEKSTAPPNILIILADDLGVGSTEPYGVDTRLVRTPAIARLAERGLTFDCAYSTASVCTPTRYAMLTGQYSWRSRLKSGVVDPYDPLLIDVGAPTIGTWLMSQGYESAHIGKWHLGYKSETFKNLLGKISPGPNDLGFDYHFGIPNNLDDLHKVYIENDHIYGLESNRVSSYGKSFYGTPYTGYDAPQRIAQQVTQDLVDYAVKWLDNRNQPDAPFFLYLALAAVHHPIMPSEKMRGTSEAGSYGDFIHDLDDSVGQLISALEHRGLTKNTIIIFASDNGGDIPGDEARPERQAVAAGLAINAQLRGDKHTIYEGGLRTPMIAVWPGVIEPGQRTKAFVTTGDLFATLADALSGAPFVDADTAPDSISFAHVLRDAQAESLRLGGVFRDALGRKALRFGDWKYIDAYYPDHPDRTAEVELYDLKHDPAEAKNLAGSRPELVLQAQELLQTVLVERSSRVLLGQEAQR